jgi:hypothetical protein
MIQETQRFFNVSHCESNKPHALSGMVYLCTELSTPGIIKHTSQARKAFDAKEIRRSFYQAILAELTACGCESY